MPNQTLWIPVPKGSILHIDELASYHLTDDEYQAEIEISQFFKQHSFVLDPELEERIKEEGTQLTDLTPVDTALEAIARLPPAGAPIIRSWSALHLYYRQICCDFDTGLPPTQASERRSRGTLLKTFHPFTASHKMPAKETGASPSVNPPPPPPPPFLISTRIQILVRVRSTLLTLARPQSPSFSSSRSFSACLFLIGRQRLKPAEMSSKRKLVAIGTVYSKKQ